MWSPARTTIVSASERSMTFMFRSTASAVPRYHSARRPRAMYGWSSFTPPVLRSRSHGRPRPMWSLREWGLYWVRTITSVMSEFTQFDSVKSMIRYLPPKGTAGLARTEERIERRSPSPPARITAIVRFTVVLLNAEESQHGPLRLQIWARLRFVWAAVRRRGFTRAMLAAGREVSAAGTGAG